MAKSNGRLTQGQVATWFNGLSIDAQHSVLTTLSNAHGKVRQQQISELRRQLAALEAPIGSRRKRKIAPTKVKYRNRPPVRLGSVVDGWRAGSQRRSRAARRWRNISFAK